MLLAAETPIATPPLSFSDRPPIGSCIDSLLGSKYAGSALPQVRALVAVACFLQTFLHFCAEQVHMVTIEGITVEAKTVPKKQLISAWRTLTSKPFPRVKAYQLRDEDFDRIIRLRWCEGDMEREREEWGRVLPTGGTDACVFNAEEAADAEYIVLVCESPYHSLKEILRHELSHIVRGDL
jgi:hypothetical protein